ncbi:MAG: hypothetical protein SXV54_21255 [Chloroflexota bacterium]|nr:hypothetical protein [Chloroflexota bacterium]
MKRIVKISLHLFVDLLEMLINYLPGPMGYILRYRFWKRRLKHLGKDVKIDVGVYFQNPHYISLDDGSWIDRNVMILAGPPSAERVTYYKDNPDFTLNRGEVYIGKCTHIAPNCVLSGIGGMYIGRNSGVASNSALYSFSHHYRNLVDRTDTYQYSFTPRARPDQQSMILGPVVIGDYCAVGLNSVILPGTSMKKGSWAASGTVVSGALSEQSLMFYDQDINTKSLSNLNIKE